LDPSHSLLQLILGASPVVQGIIALLLLASMVSWAIIFRKRRLLRQAISEANRFETAFWSGGDLGKLYRAIEARGEAATGMEGIFEAGFGEFSRLRTQGGGAPAELLEGVRRAMRVAQLPAPTSGCSARCGGSWVRSRGSATCSRRRSRWSRPASPRR
jgi:biopolymer transport protein TolQ